AKSTPSGRNVRRVGHPPSGDVRKSCATVSRCIRNRTVFPSRETPRSAAPVIARYGVGSGTAADSSVRGTGAAGAGGAAGGTGSGGLPAIAPRVAGVARTAARSSAGREAAARRTREAYRIAFRSEEGRGGR